ncbi:MAG: TonB-dependent receptor, partial [Pseudomonadota bacterium]
TDAYYDEFPNAAAPNELNYPGQSAYLDFSGETLPGIAKYSGNIGIEWNQPFGNNGGEIFWNANVSYSDKFNTDSSLSTYGWIPARTTWDIGFGYNGNIAGGNFGVSLITKNAFDDDTPLGSSWNSYNPPEPRWVGFQITGSF